MAEPEETGLQTGTDDETPSSAEQAGPARDEEKPSGGKRPTRWPWLVIPVLMLGGVAGWFVLPQETRQSWLHDIGILKDHQPVSDESTLKEPPAKSGQPQPEQQQVVSGEPARSEAVVQSEPEEPTVSSEPRSAPETGRPEIDASTVERLIAAIGELRAAIDELKTSSTELKESLAARRILDLQSRLRWLTKQDMTLAQLKLAWEDILLMPDLSDPDRKLVRKMVELSDRDLNRVGKWLKVIDGLLEKYPSAAVQETELIADDSWWAWLKKLFHLRRAPTMAVQRQNDLHDRLLRAHDRLSRQQWPDQKEWGALLAAIQEQEGSNSAVDGLPGDFSAIRHDIGSMRAAAAEWLGRL